MIFEALPTTPTSAELLDQAFSRAARAGRAKSGREAHQSMLQTASNVLSDNLANVVTAWPDFATVDPFYYELADALVGVDDLRGHLSELSWAASKTKDLGREYQGRLTGDAETDRKLRKQAFARMSSVVEEVEADLAAVAEAREALRDLPDVRPEEPAIVVAGYPNVGKTAFVNSVTRAHNEVGSYPFTTTEVLVGHLERDHVRYQLIDTPGLLDRPPAERNEIEAQAASALTHLADAVLVLLDPSETCGYPLDDQVALRDAIREQFADVPVLTVANKVDLAGGVDLPAGVGVDHEMSVETGDGVESVIDAAVAAVDWEPDLPPSRARDPPGDG